MRAKKCILGSLLATMVALSGCGGTSPVQQTEENPKAPSNNAAQETPQAQSYTLKVATVFAPTHPINIALKEKFKPMVEEKSGGTLKVNVYDNNQLGAEEAVYDGVRNGTIELGTVSTIMSKDIDIMLLGEWPFLFKDLNHAKKVFTGPIGKEIATELENKAGVKVLTWGANGIRNFSSNKPLNSVQDFKGLRLRMPNNPTYIKIGELLGANVTPLALSEVFTALEQKVVDGQDNPIATLKATGWYEVQTHVLESSHMFSPLELIMNDDLWAKLTTDQQKILEEAAAETGKYEWELYDQSLATDKKFLQEKGIQFITPDDSFRQDMIKALEPLYNTFYQEHPWTKEMIERIGKEAE